MVTIHKSETIVTNGKVVPVMRKHTLLVKKESPTFQVGETIDCFIARYDNDRFCVWDASWTSSTNYHVFESAKELHEHFDEL